MCQLSFEQFYSVYIQLSYEFLSDIVNHAVNNAVNRVYLEKRRQTNSSNLAAKCSHKDQCVKAQ